MKLTGYFWITLALTSIYAFGAEVPPAGGEGEVRAIDLETAARLAIVASYHEDFGIASTADAKRWGKTDRVTVGSFEMSSLDGTEKFYSITLYRGDGDPESLADVGERIPPWAELIASHATKREDGKYEFEMIPPSELGEVFFFDSIDEYKNYYSCVVPASMGRGFLSEFILGISPHLYYGEVALRVLAADLGVDPADVVLKTITPGYDYLCEALGEEYIVRMAGFMAWKEAEIIRGDDVAEALESGLVPIDTGLISEAEDKAEEEDIATWVTYVERIDRKFGFGPGPSISADSVNPVLMGSQERTLYQKGASAILLYDSRDDEKQPE
jgi:hypothetical protein